jgi:hypothetical protein
LGVVIGVLAALFTHLLEWFSTFQNQAPRWRRFGLAALGMAVLGWWVPESLGVGYTTINAAAAGDYLLWSLALITLAKLLATTFCLGLGIPGGLIGPTMVIGATAGGFIFALMSVGGVDVSTGSSLYIMVGMAAMMGATLQAPLSALTALLEMGHNTSLVLPGMIGIVTASLVSRVGFGKESVFHRILTARGVDFETTAMHRSLRQVGVLAAVDPSFELQSQLIDTRAMARLTESSARWLLLHDGQQPVAAVLREPLVNRFQELDWPDDDEMKADASADQLTIDLLEFFRELRQDPDGGTDKNPPIRMLTSCRVSALATLDEAHERMIDESRECFYAQAEQAQGLDGIYGLLPITDLEHYYR